MPNLVLRSTTGAPLVNAALNNLVPDVAVGDPTIVRYVVVTNTASVAVTAVRAWLGVDTNGVTVRIGLAGGTPTFPTTPTSWSIPTSDAGGLVLTSSLAAGASVIIGLWIDPASGGEAWPENNVLYVNGDGPI